MGRGLMISGVKLCLAAVAALSAVIAAPAVASAEEVFAGVYAHDLGPAARERGTVDAMVGYRTDRMDNWTWLAKPQIHIMLSKNSHFSTDFAAVGLDWPIRLTEKWYLRPGMGFAYTTGKAVLPPANVPGLTPAELAYRVHLFYSRIDFGTHYLFEPELALGYKVNTSWSAELSWVHLSNGQITHTGKNQGLDDVGARLVHRF